MSKNNISTNILTISGALYLIWWLFENNNNTVLWDKNFQSLLEFVFVFQKHML